MPPRPTVVRLVLVATVACGVGVWTGAVAIDWPFVAAAGFVAAAVLGAAAGVVEAGETPGSTRPEASMVEALTLAVLGGHAACIVASGAGAIRVWTTDRAARLEASVDAGLSIGALAVAGFVVAWGRPLLAGHAVDPVLALGPGAVAAIAVREAGLHLLGSSVPGAGIPRALTSLTAASVAIVALAGWQEHGWLFVVLIAFPGYGVFAAWRAWRARGVARVPAESGLAATDVPLCTVGPNGGIDQGNAAFYAVVRRPAAQVVGRSLLESMPTAWVPAMRDGLAQVRASGGRVSLSLPLTGEGADARSADAVLVAAGDRVLVSMHDTTAGRRARLDVERAEARLALLAAGAQDGLWECDLATRTLISSDRWKAMTGVTTGGDGHLDDWFHRVHPDDITTLTDAIETHLAGRTEYLECEHRIRQDDGSYRWFLCRGKASGIGAQRWLAGSLTDITDRADAQERIKVAALRDPLTGLPNRTVFVERLGRVLHDFKARRHGRFAILYLDLDRFKVVNDSLGHLVGDELLIAVSRRLETCLRAGDSLARLGGDEFVILVDRLSDENQANAIALRLQSVLAEPFSIGGREVFTSASIGIAFSLTDYGTPDDMMRAADMAMYHAKSRGKARHETFDADMHARAIDRLNLENALRHAVASREIEVHFQPIVSLSTCRCVGFESLVRWTRDGKPVSPALFIPVAEELGLIEAIGTWVLQHACRTFADWRRRYPDSDLEYITVNVSPRQLMQPNFPRLVEQAVRESGLAPADVRLEITETALMDAPQNVAALLGELRRFGAKVYLDDFGTGYSSLSHLHRLPVDALKIDRSFVMSLLLSDRPAIVESILALAKTLNTGVVAEGVESHSQAIELLRLGCHYAQGFYFSRPLPASAVEALLSADRPLGEAPAPVNLATSDRWQPATARRA